jgi:hypothetical protein
VIHTSQLHIVIPVAPIPLISVVFRSGTYLDLWAAITRTSASQEAAIAIMKNINEGHLTRFYDPQVESGLGLGQHSGLVIVSCPSCPIVCAHDLSFLVAPKPEKVLPITSRCHVLACAP